MAGDRPEVLLSENCHESWMSVAEVSALGAPRAAARSLGLAYPEALAAAILSRQYEYLAGRASAADALRRAGCTALADLVPGPGRAPSWPPGYIGSIAHSRGEAWAAAASTQVLQGIGIDVEHVIGAEAASDLAASVLTPDESRAAACAPYDFATYVTLLFSAKEALYKCLNPLLGVDFSFHALSAADIDARGGRLCARLVEPLAPCLPSGHEFRIQFALDGARVCTAVELPPSSLR
jgi:enterobactin synthetase component D